MKLVHWLLMGGLLRLVQWGGDWAARPILAVPNVTAHRSTASVPITVLLYDGPLLCGFSVAIKGLNAIQCSCLCSRRLSQSRLCASVIMQIISICNFLTSHSFPNDRHQRYVRPSLLPIQWPWHLNLWPQNCCQLFLTWVTSSVSLNVVWFSVWKLIMVGTWQTGGV